jgi:hypothetical protein
MTDRSCTVGKDPVAISFDRGGALSNISSGNREITDMIALLARNSAIDGMSGSPIPSEEAESRSLAFVNGCQQLRAPEHRAKEQLFALFSASAIRPLSPSPRVTDRFGRRVSVCIGEGAPRERACFGKSCHAPLLKSQRHLRRTRGASWADIRWR